MFHSNHVRCFLQEKASGRIRGRLSLRTGQIKMQELFNTRKGYQILKCVLMFALAAKMDCFLNVYTKFQVFIFL